VNRKENINLKKKMKIITKKMARKKWFKLQPNRKRKARRRRGAIKNIASQSMPKFLQTNNKLLRRTMMKVFKRKKSREMLTLYQLLFSKSLPNRVQRLRSKLLQLLHKI
jgi:hypothetical protein